MNVVEMPIRLTASNVDVSDKDLELINRHTLRPFMRDELFAYEGICSSDELDSYDTRMDPYTTLRNFSDELSQGVPLMEGHNTSINPYGRSFDSEYLEKDGVTSVRGRWYIPRSTTINGVNTDDTIKAIEAGVIKDMSVGFGGSAMWYKCSADGKDLWDTPYYPGDVDEDGNRVFFWIMDANLREVSTVYKGACPGAYIEKTRSAIESGEMDEKRIMILEDRYHTRFDNADGAFSFGKNRNKKGGQEMVGIKEVRAALEDGTLSVADLRTAMSDKGVRFEKPEDIAIRNELGDDFSTPETIRTLKADAEHGRKYLVDLIEDAVKERVAIQGEEFNADSYRKVLERSGDIYYIKEEIESYRKLKASKFTAGRQIGSDGNQEEDIIDLDDKGGK